MSEERKTIAEMSIETSLLVERLKQSAVGDVVTYAEMSTLVGRNVQGDGYSAMASARRICQREERMVFEVIRNEGLKRLNDSGIVATGGVNLKRLGRQARRGVKTLACVTDFDALPPDQQVEHNMTMSMLGALAQMVKPKQQEKLRLAVANAQQRLPLTKTLEMFTNGGAVKK